MFKTTPKSKNQQSRCRCRCPLRCGLEEIMERLGHADDEITRRVVSNIILSAGWLGIVTAIFLITLLSMTPIPTESLTIMCLKSYGIGWGIFYSWVGSTLSSVAIFLLVRSIREPILQLVISQERFAAPVHHPKAPQISTKITHHPTKSHVSKKSVHKTVKTIKSVKTAKLAKTKPKAKQSTVHA